MSSRHLRLPAVANLVAVGLSGAAVLLGRTRRRRREIPVEPSRAYDDMVRSLQISERLANEAQRESELMYLNLRQVIETANAAFLAMDSSGVITDWNSKAEGVFGWSRSEVVGRPLVDIIIPPDLRAAHTAGLRRFLETGEHRVLGTLVEFDALHRDGHQFPVEIATWATEVGDNITFGAFLRDITERRKGEEAIGRLASIVESAQEAIVSTSLDGTIVTWNHGAELTYGFAADEVLGREVAIIIPPDCHEETERARRRLLQGQSVARYETQRRRKDGTLVDVAVTSSPIFDAWGHVTGASTIARDITDQRRMGQALERALGDARKSDERSRQFLADAAHQLRSPIAGVRACAETLLRGTEETDGDRLLANIVREASRAGRLISALLRLARLDQGGAVESALCDVAAICRSDVERSRMLAPALQIDLTFTDSASGSARVDGNSMTEILSNLLDNARRHAANRVHVTVAAGAGQLSVRVEDDGLGVAEEAVERVFDRFVSLDGHGGSGLGLAIGRALARGHGGELTYDGRGITGDCGFHLVLPVHVDAVDAENGGLARRVVGSLASVRLGPEAAEAPLEIS